MDQALKDAMAELERCRAEKEGLERGILAMGSVCDALREDNERLRRALEEIEDHHGEDQSWREIARKELER